MQLTKRRNHQLTADLAGMRRGSVAKGCLIAVVIVVVLLAGVGVYVYMNAKSWTAATLQAVATSVVNSSQLPQDQKDTINARVATVSDDFKNGKITFEQLGKVLKEIGESPVLPLSMVAAAENKYVNPSALTDPEKEAGRRTLQRFARGAYEKKLAQSDTDQLLDMITIKDPQGNRTLKQQLTLDELKAVLATAKGKADGANIPDEPFTINYADEVNKAVDKALASPPPPGG